MLCYRLQTDVWQIRGVTWRRKSLNICREFPLCVGQFQKPQIPRLQCGAMPCCSLHVQSRVTVLGAWSWAPVLLLQHVWEVEVVPGRLPRWEELKGSFTVLCKRLCRLFCIGVICPLGLRELSAVVLHSSQFSKFGSQQCGFKTFCGKLG